MVATWGTLSWRASTPAGTRVEVRTRSGNTRTPDEAWSDWSAPYAQRRTARRSPAPRRAICSGARCSPARATSPVLTSVTAAYLQRNVRPEVALGHRPPAGRRLPEAVLDRRSRDCRLRRRDRRAAAGQHGSGGAPGGAPALGRRTYQKGLQTFVWKAEDENGDELTFDVLYRREGETAWKLLKGGLTDSILVWDTASAPNGSYVMKVVASDQRVESGRHGAQGRARERAASTSTTARRRSPSARSAAKAPTHRRALRGPRRRLARHARRVLARRAALAGASSRRTASSTGGRSSSRFVSTPRWPGGRWSSARPTR